MGMTPRERILAVYSGEEPDKIPVLIPKTIRRANPGWYQRLKDRGAALLGIATVYEPRMCTWREPLNPRFADVRYTRTEYCEEGVWKYRYTYETPVGTITGVVATNPTGPGANYAPHPVEHAVKQPSDWRVVNYFYKQTLDSLVPTSKETFERVEKALGDDGVVTAFLSDYTPWQNAWIWLAGPETAVTHFYEQPDEIQEFVDLSNRLHTRLAEFAAEFPANFVLLVDHITEMTSPKFYREYCLPVYEIYSKQLEGTGKILGVHMDGHFGHLKKEIAESPIDVIDSFSVPPTGDVSLAEARKLWPDKMMFMNTASHLAWSEPDEIRTAYERFAAEWGTKKGLLLELVEDLPDETVGPHLSAAMDAFGY